jgi:hypothetical protein
MKLKIYVVIIEKTAEVMLDFNSFLYVISNKSSEI